MKRYPDTESAEEMARLSQRIKDDRKAVCILLVLAAILMYKVLCGDFIASPSNDVYDQGDTDIGTAIAIQNMNNQWLFRPR